MTTRLDLITGLFPEERRYFAAAADGRLLLSECVACHAVNGPFDQVCGCGGADLGPRAARGTGTVRALTQVHRAVLTDLRARVPYWVALVELDEGPTLVATVDVDGGEPAVDDRVTASFVDCGDGWAVPEFRKMETT